LFGQTGLPGGLGANAGLPGVAGADRDLPVITPDEMWTHSKVVRFARHLFFGDAADEIDDPRHV
jgi:hypothetical protein